MINGHFTSNRSGCARGAMSCGPFEQQLDDLLAQEEVGRVPVPPGAVVSADTCASARRRTPKLSPCLRIPRRRLAGSAV